MFQIVQDLRNGITSLLDVPVPKLNRGYIKVQTRKSLVSLGTEKMLVSFGRANYLEKARQQPEKVKQVLNKIKSDGLVPTLEAVLRKLDEPIPLGYSNVGVVIEIGDDVSDIKVGDRVVSNGPHAEVVCVPENLVVRIPDEVSDEEAVFTVIGSIGLQGIRLAVPTFGETFVVTGLGLIGLITCQLLLANGCKVIGLDLDQDKLELAQSLGISTISASNNDVIARVQQMTGGHGADGVLITASSSSNEIVSQAAQMCRKRGRIILVGVVGLDLQRSDFYEKELTFQVSCSYGPGRYDANYEEKGHDYPIGYVRWTEKRNFEAILESLRDTRLKVKPLISERVPLSDYLKIYGNMSRPGIIASILEYKESYLINNTTIPTAEIDKSERGYIGVIGSGNFTSSTVMPVLKKCGIKVKYLVSASGLSSTILAKKYNVPYSTSDLDQVLTDDDVKGVIITTRHDQHANQVISALKSKKHVLVEKPLALTLEELDKIKDAYIESGMSLTVGFNRRFSPFSIKAKELIGAGSKSINVIATMNAGFVPSEHWVHDVSIGGGRIIGEACHYIDLINFFTGSEVEEVMLMSGYKTSINTDDGTIMLKYKNGSLGVLNYFSKGHKSYSKERIEIYDNGRNIIIDNFRNMKCYGYGFSGMRKKQDKGHQNQFAKWWKVLIEGGDSLIDFNSIYNVSKTSILAIESFKMKEWISI